MSETGNQVTATGVALTAARRAQGLSVADVARQLKLSVSQVEALEAGAFDKLPGPVFVRGFIRNYARLLKLDADEMLTSVEALGSRYPEPAKKPSSPGIALPAAEYRRGPRYAVLALLLVAALAVYRFYPGESQSMLTKPAPAVAASSPPPEAVALVSESAAVNPAVASPATDAAVVPAPALPAAPAADDIAGIDSSASQPLAAGKTVSEPSRPPSSGEYRLQFVFEKLSWVEVRDRSGRAIFSQLNQPGTEQRVSGMPPLSVIVGNAHGVRLIHNDKPVDIAQHTQIDVARFTLE